MRVIAEEEGARAAGIRRSSGVPSFTNTCLNCGSGLSGAYCFECGQGHRHARLRLRDWLSDVIDGIANLDSRILNTVIGLSLRPGLVARDYVQGRRVGYVSPARYALVACALWWLAVSLNPHAAQAASASWQVGYGQFLRFGELPT